jgi:cell wall-associated NlpC family hydrolase
MMMHWAAQLIGLPYVLGASGPDAFDCWGLVRWVSRTQLGVDMPIVCGAEQHSESAILRAARVSRRHLMPAGATEQEWDILLMRHQSGRHVGICVHANGGLLVLHTLAGDGVHLQRLRDLDLLGFTDFQCWRAG